MANFLTHAQRAKALTRNRVCANVAFSVLVNAGPWQRTWVRSLPGRKLGDEHIRRLSAV